MRITNNMVLNNMVKYMSTNLQRMDKYEQQLATGKKIENPSDDPIVAARALKLRTDVSEIDQYQRNASDAQSWLDITESSLQQIGDVLQRTRELAVQAGNSTNGSDDMMKIKYEVTQLKQQLVHIGNTTYAGRYIFSGHITDQRLINDDGTYAINVSNTENIQYEVGVGDNIDVNVTGGDLFNAGNNATAGQTGKLLKDMDDFISKLDSGDHQAVTDQVGIIDDNLNNVLRVRADVGARSNRLELTINRLESDSANFTKLMSENEDVDMAETIMKLKNEENVYKSSLAGGARIIQPSLIDFLK